MPAFSPVALNSRDLRGGGGGGGVGRTISSCTSDLPEGSYTANRTTPPQGKKRDCFARVSIITDSDVALYKTLGVPLGGTRRVGGLLGSARLEARFPYHDSRAKTRSPHGQRSLAGYSPQGCKELDRTEATEHACMN